MFSGTRSLQTPSTDDESEATIMWWAAVFKKVNFGRANRYIANESDFAQINTKNSSIKDKHLTRGKLLTQGHACPLGGRCLCIRYHWGRGRGPARF